MFEALERALLDTFQENLTEIGWREGPWRQSRTEVCTKESSGYHFVSGNGP